MADRLYGPPIPGAISPIPATDAMTKPVGIRDMKLYTEYDIDPNWKDDVDAELLSLDGRIDDVEGDITSLDGRLDDVEDDIDNATTGLKARLTTAENDIDQLQYDLGQAQTDISALGTSKQDKIISSSVTLALADWDGLNVNEVTVSGVTASNTVLVTPDPADVGRYATANIVCYAQDLNTLYFHADALPDQDIVVNVIIIK